MSKAHSDVVDIGPEMIMAADESVINRKGENYYRACGMFVANLPDGGQSFCVKPIKHLASVHEDYEGREKWDADTDLHLNQMTLEEAVGAALRAASVCWSDIPGAGVFDSNRAATVLDQLMNRIMQAGIIYD